MKCRAVGVGLAGLAPSEADGEWFWCCVPKQASCSKGHRSTSAGSRGLCKIGFFIGHIHTKASCGVIGERELCPERQLHSNSSSSRHQSHWPSHFPVYAVVVALIILPSLIDCLRLLVLRGWANQSSVGELLCICAAYIAHCMS